MIDVCATRQSSRHGDVPSAATRPAVLAARDALSHVSATLAQRADGQAAAPRSVGAAEAAPQPSLGRFSDSQDAFLDVIAALDAIRAMSGAIPQSLRSFLS